MRCAMAGLLLVGACSADDESSAGTGPAASELTPTEPSATEPPPTEPTSTQPAPAEPPATEPVSTEPAPTEPVSTEPGSEASMGAASYDFSAVSPVVQAFVDERGLNGAAIVVVDREDGVVYEEYWGELGPERVSLIASSTKMITAGVLLRLQDDGLLDIDAPIADFVEWGSGNPEITTAELLSNSSGMVGLGPEPTYGPYLCQFIAVGTLQDCATTIFTTPDDDADVIPPDTEFRYGGAQWQIAGAVAEAVSGKSWAELIEEIYVEPCGVESLAYNNHFAQIGSGFVYPDEFGGDPSTLIATDNPNMEGGAYIDPVDYATLLLMHLRGGMCGERQVLSQGALDIMHRDRIGIVYDGDAAFDTGYGMGWWVDRETGRISDAGAYGTVPWLDLDDGYGAYLVIEADSGTGNELAGMLYDLVDEAVTER